MHLNVECKVKVENIDIVEQKLLLLNPLFIGLDNQKDTYYNTNTGRLKLREGNIENALIHYTRSDIAGAKQSNVTLYQHQPNIELHNVLAITLGVKVVVNKIRKIYFIDNVKFHFDDVPQLGFFVEIEAIDNTGNINKETLQQQCDFYINYLELLPQQFIKNSYSDMILGKL